MTSRATVIAALACAVVAACASRPERFEPLERARTVVESATQDPLAQQIASDEVNSARSALAAADSAFEQGKPQEQVAHLAYIAERRAQIAAALTGEHRARELVARGEAERNRVLLEARTLEAERAAEAARTAQASAEARAAEADEARRSAEQARTELENVQREFADLQARRTERGMVLTLGDVLFDSGAATLKPGADLVVERLARFLNENPEVRIIVEGHTDSQGSDAYNEALSERRANAVAQALAVRNVSGDRVHAMGRGEAYPAASNANAAGRQQNRRVEIVFSDMSGRFAAKEDQSAGTLR
jgi:outer membrane protein OmpA-like peptidoglycan-associated protein